MPHVNCLTNSLGSVNNTAPILCVARLSTMICKALQYPPPPASPVSPLGIARQAQHSRSRALTPAALGRLFCFCFTPLKVSFLLPEPLFQLPHVLWSSNFLQEAFHNSPGWAGALAALTAPVPLQTPAPEHQPSPHCEHEQGLGLKTSVHLYSHRPA